MTYDEILASVLSTLEVDEADIRAEFPNFVERAQLGIQQALDINTSRRFFEATVAQGVDGITLPPETTVIRTVVILAPSTGLWMGLLHKDRSFLLDFDPTRAATGDPRYYAYNDNQSMTISPAPSADTQIEASVLVRIPILGPAIQENWLSTDVPHLFIYAILIEAAIFNKMADTDIKNYRDQYTAALEGTGNEVYRRRRTDEYREGTPQL